MKIYHQTNLFVQHILSDRILAHILFWIAYYSYRLYWYAIFVGINTPENVTVVQTLEMPLKIAVVYINLYLLMPFLLSRKYLTGYVLAVLGLLTVATLLQREIVGFCIQQGFIGASYDLFSFNRLISIASHIVNVFVLTTLIKVVKDAYLNLKINKQLMEDKLETELKFLKSQINPHFFFNTLNNLYALVLIKSDEAPAVILKLSDLMSYMLYETNQAEVALDKEIKYLQDYVALEKLRFGEELTLSFEVSGHIAQQKIHPVLLIPFVENAFKHAKKDTSQKVWIAIRLAVEENGLVLEVKNSFAPPSAEKTGSGGIGLANVQRRLELLYKNKFDLQTSTQENVFVALLHIDLD